MRAILGTIIRELPKLECDVVLVLHLRVGVNPQG